MSSQVDNIADAAAGELDDVAEVLKVADELMKESQLQSQTQVQAQSQTQIQTDVRPPSTSPQPVITPVSEFFNVIQACELISRHYNREFKDLRFRLRGQLIDGCVAEFTSDEAVIATARIRFRNRLEIDTATGSMKCAINMSDLTFQQSELKLTVMSKQ